MNYSHQAYTNLKIAQNEVIPIFYGLLSSANYFSFLWRVCSANKTLDLFTWPLPTDQDGNNIAKRIEAVADVVLQIGQLRESTGMGSSGFSVRG